ncbi:methyl-accepting chemotaxis protein [Dyella sp. ASV21]|uniref:methyl-accepting chemotaxis protein n=1 Tax=Dyella sp. ASV21 TaxID=2795114 RepID=UPI0018EA8B9D|nr:methyl-accepting chemotaxis protein [Dyella sp. ASV21]
MTAKLAGAPALDAYLHQSFEVIQYVADNMPAIKAVAGHLTPVEDLVDFKATIDDLHAKLGLLVEASELIIQTTPAGIRLLLAPDAPSQRLVMGLGSASVKDASYFAKTTDFDALSRYVGEIKLITDQLTEDLAKRATKVELDAAVDGLQTQITDLAAVVASGARINEIIEGLAKGEYTDLVNSQISLLTSRVNDAEGNLAGQAITMGQLSSQVKTNAGGITALSQDLVSLRTQVSDTEAQLAGNTTSIHELSGRTETLEGKVTTQAEDLTQLSAKADNLASNISAQSDALHQLQTFASNTDGEQKSTANEVSQLAGRITVAEDGIAAGVEAMHSLSTELEATQAGLSAAATDVTKLKASITGTGNLLPNTAFEADTRAWTFFSHGTGWVASQLKLNLDPTRLPPALNVLSTSANGVPSGTAGIRSQRIPISAQTKYILSGYLAAENCTFAMEWRLFNAAGVQVGLGVVGQVTNVAPANNLVNWARVFNGVQTSADAAMLEVQLWVTNCNTAPPKVWFLRPMMEEAVGTQTEPSPWVPGVSGLEETMATAINELTVRVESTEAGLLAQAESVTKLQARIGNVVHWRVVTIAGSGNAASVGAPLEPTIRVLGDPNALAAYTFQRGLTLIRFSANGEIESATRFDTYASVTERRNLTAALEALGPNDDFLLVSENNHGIKDAPLTAAMERCGANLFSTISGSTPYALRGRGGIGKGGGIENFPTSENQYIDFSLTTVNDRVQGLGDQAVLSGVADAVQQMSTKVEEIAGEMTAVAAANTALSARTDGSEAALVNELIIRASRNALVTSQVNLMDSRLTSAETGLTAAATTVAGYETRMTNAEGAISSQTQKIDHLSNVVDGELAGTNETIAALSSKVDRQGDTITAQGSSITSLTSKVDDSKTGLAATASGLSGLTTRVSSAEGSLSSQATQISSLDTKIGSVSTSLSSESTARASADTALGSRIDTLKTTVDGNTAAITAEQTARANGDSANAASITSLSTTVGGHTASITTMQQSIDGVRARAGVMLDVNGRVTGWSLNNDGKSGTFDVVADRFSVSNPAGGDSLTWTGGVQIARSGAYMKVTGPGFGNAGQFIEWYGPVMQTWQCSEANALYYLKKDGSAYFGGSLSAGILKNSIATSIVSNTAQVETSPFGTNGRSKVIVASLFYGVNGTVNGNAAGYYNGLQTDAVITLYRSYAGGGWQWINAITVYGSCQADYDGEFKRTNITQRLDGAITMTDSLGGTGTFNYLLQVSNAHGWPTQMANGNTGNQRLTIVSTES